MNNRGQSLIIFVLLLPLIVLLIAFFIDSSLSMMEKNRLDGIITSNIEESLNNDIRDLDKISKAINKNDNLEANVSVLDDTLQIKVSSKKNSLFGKILNFSWYQLDYNYCGNYITKEINKNCG